MKKHIFWFVVGSCLLAMAWGAGQAWAADAVVGDGSPASCTEAAFDGALAAAGGGGGAITFNCGANPHTIQFTSAKTLTDDIIIDGGDLITLSGGDAVRPFRVTGNPVEISHLTLTQGQAGQGGAIQVAASGYLTLADSHLTANTATSVGGGLHVDGGTAVFIRTTLDNNNANYGGGIYNSGTLTMTDVTLADNNGTSGGGGLYNLKSAALSHVTMAGNNGGDGGGVFNWNSGAVTVTNATLSQNEANFGGGLYNRGAAVLTNVTVAANQALGGGGGILHGNDNVAHLSLTNVILAQNTSPTTANDQCLLYKAPDSFTYSLWLGTSCGSSTADGNQPDTDALLAPLAFTGTGLLTELTMTHALLAGSPAEDLGTCDGGAPPTDQRGVDRPQGAGCDIGALETIPVPPVYGVALAGGETLGGNSGTAVTHTLTLTNTGNITDTLDLTLGTAVWPAQFSQSSVTLAAYASTVVTVVVDIPTNALSGETDSVTVTAVSQGDANQTAELTLTTRVNYLNFLPMLIKP